MLRCGGNLSIPLTLISEIWKVSTCVRAATVSLSEVLRIQYLEQHFRMYLLCHAPKWWLNLGRWTSAISSTKYIPIIMKACPNSPREVSCLYVYTFWRNISSHSVIFTEVYMHTCRLTLGVQPPSHVRALSNTGRFSSSYPMWPHFERVVRECQASRQRKCKFRGAPPAVHVMF